MKKSAIQHDTSPDAPTRPGGEILLISMPFGLPYLPSLGLATVKAELAERGLPTKVRYLGIDFANRLGYDLYLSVAHGNADYLGDWIFYRALWGEPAPAAEETFWREAFPGGDAQGLAPSFDQLKERVRAAQLEACDFIDQLVADTDWQSYALVGFSTMFQQNVASLALAKRVKEAAPDTPILFGGPNAEAPMGTALARCFPFIDFVFSGESDASFPPFAEALLHGRPLPQVPGLIQRDAETGAVLEPACESFSVTDMDELPYPDFDDFFEQLLASAHPIRPHLSYETARGCWWGAKQHCTFCGLNGATMAFRSKSAERALAEIGHLYRRYVEPHGVALLQPADEILDIRYFDSVLPGLPEVAGGTPLFCEIKSNVQRRQVARLAEANVRVVQPGIESLSTPILQLMRKGCTMLQNIQLLKWSAEYGIMPVWNLLYGFPGEEAEEYHKMARLFPSLAHLPPPKRAARIDVDRFSPYFSDSEAWGIANLRPPKLHNLFYPFSAKDQYDICYTFDYDLEKEGPSAAIEECVVAARDCWMASPHRGSLVGFRNAEGLLVWDDRQVAENAWTLLPGDWAELLLLCDRAQPRRRLEARLEELHPGLTEKERSDAVDRFLAEMARRRFVVSENDLHLGLVVTPNDVESPKLGDVGARWLAPLFETPGKASEPPSPADDAVAPERRLTALDEAEASKDVRVRLHLFAFESRNGDGGPATDRVSGTCSVDSGLGSSSYLVEGALTTRRGTPANGARPGEQQLDVQQLELTGRRLSGYDAGTLHLKLAELVRWGGTNGTSTGSAELLFTDRHNAALPVPVRGLALSPGGELAEMRCAGAQSGYVVESFLADGEHLGGASD